jgi:hypothetical protein
VIRAGSAGPTNRNYHVKESLVQYERAVRRTLAVAALLIAGSTFAATAAHAAPAETVSCPGQDQVSFDEDEHARVKRLGNSGRRLEVRVFASRNSSDYDSYFFETAAPCRLSFDVKDDRVVVKARASGDN